MTWLFVSNSSLKFIFLSNLAKLNQIKLFFQFSLQSTLNYDKKILKLYFCMQYLITSPISTPAIFFIFVFSYFSNIFVFLMIFFVFQHTKK
jgi:hypothetical protein